MCKNHIPGITISATVRRCTAPLKQITVSKTHQTGESIMLKQNFRNHDVMAGTGGG